MSTTDNIQTLRFRRPNAQPVAAKTPMPRHAGILQDQIRRAQRRPWTPSFSLALRILFLIRVSGAMYSNMDDCDEVYNFWEPLHFFQHGYGFQTWELSPKYALRSWAYILLHSFPTRIGQLILDGDKRASFFAVRILLAAVSVFAEASFYRTVVEKINDRVGRYLFFMLAFSAGMWNASTAFLPSSFAMYATSFAYSYALSPSSLSNNRKTIATTILFAFGAIIGWPFALALAIPFVFEELFVFGADRVSAEVKTSWVVKRWKRMCATAFAAALIFMPVVGIDSLAYGKLSIVPWNIIRYNIFGGSERGPDLYGTAPWTFYFSNLVLNFNILVLLALLSLPALVVTYFVDRKRLGFATPSANESSPFTILGLRLAPFYLWLAILTLQPHKEERFMFPAYPLLCLNAAVCIYLMRGWLEVIFIKITKSPYQASQTLIFRNFTFSILVGATVVSISRIVAQYHYYHAPLSIAFNFQIHELPRLLNISGLLPEYPGTPEDEKPRVDLTPIKEFNLTLCYGKEWHRFPGNFLVPSGVRVQFIKSDFDGLLPGQFLEEVPIAESKLSKWWTRPQTRYVAPDLNDLNKEVLSHYVNVEECDYLVDLDFPKHPVSSKAEPRYAIMSGTWERVHCEPFLDTTHSMLLTRAFWFPGESWQKWNEFGDYCLLKNRTSVARKGVEVSGRVKRRK